MPIERADNVAKVKKSVALVDQDNHKKVNTKQLEQALEDDVETLASDVLHYVQGRAKVTEQQSALDAKHKQIQQQLQKANIELFILKPEDETGAIVAKVTNNQKVTYDEAAIRKAIGKRKFASISSPVATVNFEAMRKAIKAHPLLAEVIQSFVSIERRLDYTQLAFSLETGEIDPEAIRPHITTQDNHRLNIRGTDKTPLEIIQDNDAFVV